MLPMVAGLVALCGVVIVGVIDATDLAITRTALQSTADAAALVGAESFNPARAIVDGDVLEVRLTDRGVRRAVRVFLRDARPDVRLDAATSSDGVTAEVVVRARWEPPLVSEFLPLHIPLTATARARSVFAAPD
ncbi:MAG: hypothetical protein RLZZ319_227 [Actinomycetota bacterium]